jgi:pimeloyl-ACP methyl ester carboxylesterase
LKYIRTASLGVAYEEGGPADGEAVVLLHGFPYDPRAYDEIVPRLASAGLRTITPYLRGYGSTRFLSPDTPRSGQQAALARDLLDLLDALEIPAAGLVGYDWGGRAACIVAALWPERARFLVTIGGYNIQDIAASVRPAAPEHEYRLWYQYYFHTERGRAGLAANRAALGKLLWRLWSPSWRFDDATYDRTAASFDNPDFVEVVIHSYRHRYGYAPGDPALESIERQLAGQPAIDVPTIVLYGADDGVTPAPASAAADPRFTQLRRGEIMPGAGHNLPQEKPDVIVQAVLDLAASLPRPAAARPRPA